MNFPLFQRNLGIDLGTSNTLVYLKNKGVILNEPSIVAFNNRSNRIIAVGREARRMLNRTPIHINAVYPLVNGVISEFEMAEEMIRQFLSSVRGSAFHTQIVAAIPTNLTEVEYKSVEDVFKKAGASTVYLVPQPIAAALGSRLAIDEPTAYLVVDIGGGVTNVAIISMNGIVVSQRIKIAGNRFNEDIIRLVREEFKMTIGEPTAEEIKIAIGSAVPQTEKLEISARGQDIGSGLPKEITVRDHLVRLAFSRSLRELMNSIRETIEITPPELVGDIYRNGLYLCGGGSMLRGIDELIQKELSVNVQRVDDPLSCVVRGTGVIIENMQKYESLLYDLSRTKLS